MSKPVCVDKINGVEMAIWKNSFQDKSGKERTRKSVSLQKSYFDKKSNGWKQTNFLSVEDAMAAVALLNRFITDSIYQPKKGGNSNEQHDPFAQDGDVPF